LVGLELWIVRSTASVVVNQKNVFFHCFQWVKVSLFPYELRLLGTHS
jgi:hypothetical protein